MASESITSISQTSSIGSLSLDKAQPVPNSNVDLFQPIGSTILDEKPSVPKPNVDLARTIRSSILNDVPPVPESNLEMFQSIGPSILDEKPIIPELNVDLIQPIGFFILDEKPIISELNVDLIQPIDSSILNDVPPVLESNLEMFQPIGSSTLNQVSPVSTESNLEMFQPIGSSTLNQVSPVSTESNLDMFQPIGSSTLNQVSSVLTESNLEMFQPIGSSISDEKPIIPELNADLIQPIGSFILDEKPIISELNVDLIQPIESSILNDVPPVPESSLGLFQPIGPSISEEKPIIPELNVDLIQPIESSNLNDVPPVSTESNVDLFQPIALSTLDEALSVSSELNLDLFQPIGSSTLNQVSLVSTESSLEMFQPIGSSTVPATIRNSSLSCQRHLRSNYTRCTQPNSKVAIDSTSSKALKRDSFENSTELSDSKPTTNQSTRFSLNKARHVTLSSSCLINLIEPSFDSSNLNNDGLCPNKILVLQTKKGFCRILYRGSLFNRNNISSCKQFYYWKCYQCKVMLKTALDCRRLVNVSTGSHRGHLDNRFPQDLFRYQHSIEEDDEPLFRKGDSIPNEVHNRSRCSYCSDQSNRVQEETETIVPAIESSTMVSNLNDSTNVPECSSVCEQFQPKEHSTQSDTTLHETPSVPQSLKLKPIFRIGQFDDPEHSNLDILNVPSTSSNKRKRNLFENSGELSFSKRLRSSNKACHVASSSSSSCLTSPTNSVEPSGETLNLSDDDNDNGKDDNTFCSNEIQVLKTKKGFCRILYRGSLFNRNNKSSCKQFYYWRCNQFKVMLKTTLDYRRLVNVSNSSHSDRSDYSFPQDLFRYQHSIEEDDEPLFRKGDLIPNEVHNRSQCSRCSSGQSNSDKEDTETTVPSTIETNVESNQPSDTTTVSEVPNKPLPASFLSTLRSILPDLALVDDTRSMTISELNTELSHYKQIESESDSFFSEWDSTELVDDDNEKVEEEEPEVVDVDQPESIVPSEEVPVPIPESELSRLASKLNLAVTKGEPVNFRRLILAKEQIRLNTEQRRLAEELKWYDQKQKELIKEWDKLN